MQPTQTTDFQKLQQQIVNEDESDQIVVVFLTLLLYGLVVERRSISGSAWRSRRWSIVVHRSNQVENKIYVGTFEIASIV